MEDLAYDVYHKRSDTFIGFKWGPGKGGIVFDQDQNVVGIIIRGVVGEWILKADQSHHTGKRWDGDEIVWDSRPSKKFQDDNEFKVS
jgi:hypothetical protein